MLHRPILSRLVTKMGAFEALDSTRINTLTDELTSSFELECGKVCVEAAIKLSALIFATHQTETADMWWWNGLCKKHLDPLPVSLRFFFI